MADTAYQILFSGTAVDETFYGDVLALTVEENTETAGSMRLRLMLTLQDDGSWNYLDDDRLTLFAKVTVMIGFTGAGGLAGTLGSLVGGGGGDNGLVTVFEGYITSSTVSVTSDAAENSLDITALDTSVLMGLEEKAVAWPNMADSDIVTAILGNYNVATEIDTTTPTHQDSDTTAIQRGTDLQFVRHLARKNGLEFFFETAKPGGITAYFRAPQLDSTPQPDLAIQFGDETNLLQFEARLSGQRPLNVKTRQLDVKTQSVNSAQVSTTERTELGKDDLNALIESPLDSLVTPLDAQAQMLVLGTPTADSTELQAIAQAVRDEAAWLITASGTIDVDSYQTVLRPHRLVLVKGMGSSFSGKYYVTAVVHEIASDGTYNLKFEARRNARGIDGSENFGGTGLGVSIPGI